MGLMPSFSAHPPAQLPAHPTAQLLNHFYNAVHNRPYTQQVMENWPISDGSWTVLSAKGQEPIGCFLGA